MGYRFDNKKIEELTEYYCFGPSFGDDFLKENMRFIVDYVVKDQLRTPTIFATSLHQHPGINAFNKFSNEIAKLLERDDEHIRFLLRRAIMKFVKEEYGAVFEAMKYEVDGEKIPSRWIAHIQEALRDDGKIFKLMDNVKVNDSLDDYVNEDKSTNYKRARQLLQRGEVDRIFEARLEDEARHVIVRVREAVERKAVGEEIYKKIEDGAGKFMHKLGIRSLEELASMPVIASNIG